MEYVLNPAVIDDARRKGGFTSDDKLAASIDSTGTTLRSLRKGRRVPSVPTLMKLRRISGWSLDDMIIEKQTNN